MANPIVLPSGAPFVLAMGVPVLGPSQTRISGRLLLPYTGAGLPLSSPLLLTERPVVFTPGAEPVTYDATRMFLMFC